MRLLSLSFMFFFVLGLWWREERRPRETTARKPVSDKPRDEKRRPTGTRRAEARAAVAPAIHA
jgi:hypothetical protein